MNMKNKNGFTLIELLSVLIILIVVVTMATLNLMPSYENGKMKTLVEEAFVISEGGLNKYADDRLNKHYSSDLFGGKNANKKCYPFNSLFGKYVNKDDKDYKGSIELCTGESCTYSTKIWLTDGTYYLNGVIVDDTLSVDDLEKSSTVTNFETCGVDVSNIENVYLFDFTEAEETFVVPKDGIYSLEAWGASGGGKLHIVRASFGGGNSISYVNGGKGGYSYTEVLLKAGDVLYVTVGGEGPYAPADISVKIPGGFNGGGMANYHAGGGGGATHIALKSGPIYSVAMEDILLVAGGGGGATEGWYCIGGEGDAGWTDGGYATSGRNGGGYCDSSGYVCNGDTSRTLGKSNYLGGGGGLYTSNGMPLDYTIKSYSWGGYVWYYECKYSTSLIAMGGTGYIGNPLTKNGIMYSLNNSNTNTGEYTITMNTPDYSSEPVAYTAKQGNGFARITYIGKRGNNKDFGYKGTVQTFTVPETGNYRLEVWGAQGGGSSKGGYAAGDILLNKDEVLYIYVGGQGTVGTFSASPQPGGYNGGANGGRASSDWGGGPSGGGATHIATVSGLLSELSDNTDKILIVAGGGGGDFGGLGIDDASGGSGGGFKGVKGYASTSAGGTQTTGYAFGIGSPGKNGYYGNGGSGGGFYGGYTSPDPNSANSGGSGGSGYIGNSRSTNKEMYCFRCEESNDVDTKTVSTNCFDSDARSQCSRVGNGYARITFLDE